MALISLNPTRSAELWDRLVASARLRFIWAASLITALFIASFVGVCFQLGRTVSEAQSDDVRTIEIRRLGELSDRLSELRLSQAILLLAPDEESRAAVKAMAARHRQVLDREKAMLVATAPVDASRRAHAAVDAYVTVEQHWEATLNDTVVARARFESDTKAAYDIADRCVDVVINATSRAAHQEAISIAARAKNLMTVVMMIGAFVCGVSILAIRRLDATLLNPLGKITTALGELSSGRSEITFPALHRTDEMGRLVKAFQRFRVSADALREAYAATKLAEESAARLARHDSLTGLFNRRSLCARIDELSAQTNVNAQACFYLYVIDLDRFKPVNDLHGHAAGDAVLCAIASRLRDLCQDDIVARLGGDEFAALVRIDSITPTLDATLMASRMQQAICAPVQVDHWQLEVGGSIGAALLGRDGCDADSLLRSADAAMYCAKDGPGTSIRFFEESMRNALREQAELEVDVRIAVANDCIEPYYQPLVDLRENRIYGFELLARWTHSQRGCVLPDTFIPVIEGLGLSTPFTLSMLRRACRHARNWPTHVVLAVNVSPRQLVDPALPTQLIGVLLEEGFAAERLEIEMTETALVGDPSAARATIDGFRRLGIRVSLDDFGTGYSSLHHLRELKFDTIKIDRSFVQSMLCDTESEKIVDAILDLTAKLGLSTLAEGIETSEVMNTLRTRGCRFGQGYYFGEAVPGSDVLALLGRRIHFPTTGFGDGWCNASELAISNGDKCIGSARL